MDEDKPPYNFKALLRKTKHHQLDNEMKDTRNDSSSFLHPFEGYRKLKQVAPKIMKENQRNGAENIFRKEMKVNHNPIESKSLQEEPFILSEKAKSSTVESLDTASSSEICLNNYFEAEIEPGLLLSGQLVEI